MWIISRHWHSRSIYRQWHSIYLPTWHTHKHIQFNQMHNRKINNKIYRSLQVVPTQWIFSTDYMCIMLLSWNKSQCCLNTDSFGSVNSSRRPVYIMFSGYIHTQTARLQQRNHAFEVRSSAVTMTLRFLD